MARKLSGGCLCGAVRYELNAEPIMSVHCHCRDCQRMTGAGHVTAAAFPAEAVKVTGTMKTVTVKGDSGHDVVRYFCPSCGSWLIGKPSMMPQITTVTLGTLDDPNAIGGISVIVYAKRRNAWDHMDPKLPSFETLPPPQAMPPSS